MRRYDSCAPLTISSGCWLRPGSVFEHHDPTVGHGLAIGEAERPAPALRQQPYAAAEQYRADCQLDRIHQPGVEQAAKKNAAAEEPDVLARFSFQRHNCFSDAAAQDGYILMLRGIEGGRNYDRLHLHALEQRALGLRKIEGSAAHQERIELAEQRAEVERRIVNDPVVLALRSSDKAVQAHGDAVA
jgi:hypothetical protein